MQKAAVAGAPLVHIEAVRFASPTHAVAVSFNLPAQVNPGPWAMTSDDAGLTWTPRAVPFGKGGQIQDLACAGPVCVAAGTGGGVVVSSDGGVSWTPQPSGTQAGLEAVVFADAKKGWAVGKGVLLATTDGGASWQAKPGAQRGVAVMLGGQIVRTQDGGVTWKADAWPTFNNLFDVRATVAGYRRQGVAQAYRSGLHFDIVGNLTPTKHFHLGLGWQSTPADRTSKACRRQRIATSRIALGLQPRCRYIAPASPGPRTRYTCA